MPGALETTCGSPCGMTAMSPSSSLTGSNGAPSTIVIQHEPRVSTWYSIACCAPGFTASAICADGGASATHGEAAATSKNTAPVSRTAERTSDSTSAGMAISLERRNTTGSHASTRPAAPRGFVTGLDARARNPAAQSFVPAAPGSNTLAARPCGRTAYTHDLETDMTTIIDCLPAPDLKAIKTIQQAAWSSGDYAVVGATLQIVGEQLAEAM